jgi:hypothetical protein
MQRRFVITLHHHHVLDRCCLICYVLCVMWCVAIRDLPSASIPSLLSRIRLLKWSDLQLGDRLGEGSFGVCHRAVWNHGLVVVKMPSAKSVDV